ncbi:MULTISPECIES: DUF2000 domain-containing protein [unclassified Tenacibaculum]|uniref:DUF2000 domain-containing protein n=1 Tax=unclassified Tenacibaculum TaxID=2635139 RepID=UPI001F2357D8|nr:MULTISPECIES: DUF2000 domain-containing protein [unclassified Tenacibaculum]MCF2875786.1 DUF2000 domain-containing protein [Tenacibaculum sp. Cn5-1]MCF2935862.1 DUF2000 domain-containing protein [Tenacibaculum sp. Cn5-34]MCG7512422.1 DUF2000 domain-containing protein [Tenacibaculum sp. Cn5-46]
MTIDSKIAIVVKDDLANWQKLNVVSFLGSSIAIKFPETHGKPFVNASKEEYLPFIKHPILIYKAIDKQQITRAFNRAKERDLHIGIYTQPLFSTKNEAGNHIEIAKCTDEQQDLVGIIMYGENRKVSKALNGLKFHD